MRYFAMLCFLLGWNSAITAQSRHDALKSLVAQSDFIIVGELSSDPTVTAKKPGAVAYALDLKISANSEETVLKNQSPKIGKPIPALRVDVPLALKFTRMEVSDDDKLSFLKKGSKCILFLKYREDSTGHYEYGELADVWLGIQPYSPTLAKTIPDISYKEFTPVKK